MAKYIKTEEGYKRLEDVDIYTKMDKVNPIGAGSFSMNRKTGTTIGSYSHAEGYNTIASGYASHAEGEGTTASGQRSHAEGYYTEASGAHSHAEGYNTIASSTNSHAEGATTTASGGNSHAEGYNTIASNAASHAEGDGTTASGSYSHAEGYYTEASGYASHAEGRKTIASGNESHAEGFYTTASGNYQHAQGKYNIEDSVSKYVHIVGNGASKSNHSNAHTLDWNGVGWYQGGLQVGGNAQDDGAKNVLLEGDAIPAPETAEVGQVMRVSEVDEDGKPVAWETTNLTDDIYVTLSTKYVAGTGIVGVCNTDYQVMYDAIKNNKRVIFEDSIGRISKKSADVETICFFIYMSNGCHIYEIYNDNSVVYTLTALFEARKIAQETGQAPAFTMSQKAITDALELKADKTDVVAAPTTAEVGQTVVVSEVDENGKPVAWEATTPSAVQLIIWEDGD